MPSSSSRAVARRLALRRRRGAPVQPRDHLAGEAHAVGVVLGEIFAEPRHMRVHHGAAELFVGRDLAGRGLQQRRAGEERLGAPAHHDDVVGQPRHVGAARRGRAVHHGDDRNAGGGQLRQIVEDRAAMDEALDAIAQQVRAGGFDQMHEGQLVLERQLLRAQQLLAPHVLDRAGVDALIARHHHAAHARHIADAGDHAAAGHGFVEIGRVEAVARDRGELQPRRADVEQARDALARQQLPAPVEQRLCLRGLLARAARLSQRAQLASISDEHVARLRAKPRRLTSISGFDIGGQEVTPAPWACAPDEIPRTAGRRGRPLPARRGSSSASRSAPRRRCGCTSRR